MPIVAVVAAIAIDGAALAGGIAAMSTLTAITAIGATMGAIGAVTHNKTLSMIGAGLGIVGGIGTLAFGSDALGSVGDLFGSSSAGGAEAGAAVGDTIATDAGAEAAYQPGAVAASDLPGAATTAGNAADVVAAANPVGAINATSAAAEGNVAAIAGGEAGGPLAGELSGTGSATLTGSQVSAFAPSASAGTLPDGATLTDPWSDAINAAGKANFGADVPTGMAAWAKNNQMLSYGIIQAGGSFISGLTNPMTPAQINALDSQANANNAAAALAQRQAANMSGGLPTATVTGRPASTSGLINNNPTKAPLITGAPNTAPSAPQPVTGTV